MGRASPKSICWTYLERGVAACSSRGSPTIRQSEYLKCRLPCKWSPGLNPLDHFSDSEGELTLCAGDYLLVWGSGEPQGGYFDAELLDGRRGLVPASYVQRLIGQ